MIQSSTTSKPRIGWHQLVHTADLAFRVYGETVADLFNNAARALYGAITDRRKIRVRTRQQVDVEAPDQEALLVEWLNQLLYLFDTEGFIGREIQVEEITAQRLQAWVGGEPFDPERHEFKTGIKAATYHNLEVKKAAAGWEATIILDI
jgi:SHS2 domain-containing protein